MCISYTAKITSKGQLTVPKPIRDRLDSHVVEFEVKDDHIEMRAVEPVAGFLERYANPDRIPDESQAWKRAVRSDHADR